MIFDQSVEGESSECCLFKFQSFLGGFFHAKGHDLQWTTQHQSTFDAMKHALVPQSYSTTPVPLTPLASPLTHLTWAVDSNWKPLAFFSRKLDKAQKSYSTIDHELLAMYSANTSKDDDFTSIPTINHLYLPWLTAQQRHLAFLAEYTTDVCHAQTPRQAWLPKLKKKETWMAMKTACFGPCHVSLENALSFAKYL